MNVTEHIVTLRKLRTTLGLVRASLNDLAEGIGQYEHDPNNPLPADFATYLHVAARTLADLGKTINTRVATLLVALPEPKEFPKCPPKPSTSPPTS